MLTNIIMSLGYLVMGCITAGIARIMELDGKEDGISVLFGIFCIVTLPALIMIACARLAGYIADYIRYYRIDEHDEAHKTQEISDNITQKYWS